MRAVSDSESPPRPIGMIAKYNGMNQDRCGLPIHAGHDEIEAGHFGFRHVDCDRAQAFAWVRERIAAGDSPSDVQLKLMATPGLAPAARVDASVYALDYQGVPH